jgi:hypothetical protein
VVSVCLFPLHFIGTSFLSVSVVSSQLTLSFMRRIFDVQKREKDEYSINVEKLLTYFTF